jgi:TonB-dependent starch-binding outer membrane protein SusC
MKAFKLIFLIQCCSLLAVSQSQSVQGRVTSASDQQPLAGVNVIIKGTTTGTTTDTDGKFSISVNPKETLLFSFIGYTAVEVVIANQTSLEILMTEDVSTLNEVTVVSTGYQELPKERATGSFVQIDQQLANRRVSTDILSRLEDVTSGLIFNRNIPGKTNDISIRGTSTIFANTMPLIVIDNFPYDGDINNINPNDVASVTVLKDAAAASIWGARAGNGVIVITTKKGKLNQPVKVSLNSNVTVFDKPDLFYAPRMSSSDFIDVEKKLFDNGYYSAFENSYNYAPLSPVVELLIAQRDGILSPTQVQDQLSVLRRQDVRNDFQKYFYRKGVNQQYAISLSGGSSVNRYFFSVGWDKNLESLVGNNFNRVTLNAGNTWSALKDKMEISAGIYYSESLKQSNNDGPGAIRVAPTIPLYPYAALKDQNGNNLPVIIDYRASFVQQAETAGLLNWQYIPLNEFNLRSNNTNLVDYRINTKLGYKLFDGLKAEVLYQYWRNVSERRDLHTPGSYYARNLVNEFTQVDAGGNLVKTIPDGGVLDLFTSASASNNIRTQLLYARKFGDHEVNALAGYEVKELNTTGSSFRYYGYNDDLATIQVVDYTTFFTPYNNPFGQLRIFNNDGQSSLTDRFLSYYGNAAYTYRRHYSFSASARKDQSNLFGVKANQRGVPLWSAGLAWTVSDESFYHLNAIPYLKLRSTFGYNGNINNSVTAFTTAYMLGSDGLTGLPSARIINPPNPQLQWERVKVFNTGLDFGLKNHVVSGSLEYYTKAGIDLIGTRPFAPSTGISNFTGNTASTIGHGVDLVLNTVNVNRAIQWNTNFLLTYLAEKVTSYKTKGDASTYLLYSTGISGLTYPLEGKPLYALYSYKWAGLDPTTGDPRSYLNGQPSSDYASIIDKATPENIIYHGPARPPWFGSLRNTITWNNFSFSFNIAYRLGYYYRRNSIYYNTLLTGAVEHGDYAQRWQKPGDETRTNVPSMPSAIDVNRDNIYLYSSALVEKGDHIRLQDITLNYTFDKKTFGKMPFERAQVYFYANNLGLLWKASKLNMDPDYPTLKPVRSVALGIKIDF